MGLTGSRCKWITARVQTYRAFAEIFLRFLIRHFGFVIDVKRLNSLYNECQSRPEQLGSVR